MKIDSIAKLILLILTVSVCSAILISVVGIVIKGSATPSPESVEIRKQLINMMNIIIGGIISSLGTILAMTHKKDKDDRQNL
jgi:hypothetical protein